MSIVLLGATSGSVTLQEPAVAGTTVIDLPATSGTMAVLPTATGVLTEAAGGTGTTTGYYGFKNRIINGAMVIDQRNAGASQTPTNTAYMLDRYAINVSQTSKLTQQQNAGSVTPPVGFTKYMGFTSSSAYSVTSTDYFAFYQAIEGLNVADLAWGTASAATVTLSFWVRSSLTGAFGGSLRNGTAARSYPFSYTISSANTWEQKSVTIVGDTSGTWSTDTGVGLLVGFSLGTGSTFNGTVNTWGAGNYIQPSGSTSVVGTSGATFYITGVQLEKGSTATSFDYRPYGTELDLCYRYYFQSNQFSTYSPIGVGRAWGSGNGNAPYYLPAAMRSNPTITYSSLSHFDVVTLGNPTAIQNDGAGTNNVKVGWAKAVTSGNLYQFEFGNQTNGWLGFSAEL